VTLVIVTVWLTWLFLRLDSRARLKVLICVYLILASVALSIYGRNLEEIFAGFGRVSLWRLERYFFFGSCLLIYLTALTAEFIFKSSKREHLQLLFVLVFLGGVLGNFRIPAFPNFEWERHAKAIQAWVDAGPGGQRTAVSVPINPPGWKIELPQ
jgi:hypothetical protein